MKRIMVKRCALSVAIAALSTSAYAACDEEIRQLEQKAEKLGEHQQTQIQELLTAAEQNPGDCDAYVTRAEEVIEKQSGQASGSSQQVVQRASEAMGQTVKNDQDEEIGELADFALDMENGKLAYVVLSTGGMLSSSKVGIPADKLRWDPQGENYVADLSKQQLESAGSLPDQDWPVQPTIGGDGTSGGIAQPASQLMGQAVRDAQGNNLGEISDFAIDLDQGTLAYVVLSTGGLLSEKLVGVPASALQSSQDGYLASLSQREVDTAPELPEQNWPKQPTIASAADMPGAGGVEQASSIKGQTVTNKQGETLGQIEEFALDMENGKIAYVALRTQEGKQVGIPAGELEQPEQGEGYVADISLQQLQSLQELPRQNWPEQVSLSGSGSQASSGSATSFSSLDEDQDGYISQQEAEQASQLSQDFDDLDENSDQQIDRSEFAAFEQKQQ